MMQLYSKNIEHFVGTVKIPVGIIGPVSVITEENKHIALPPNPVCTKQKDYYVPLASTEHGLITDFALGATATFFSGGVTAAVVKRVMAQTPVLLILIVSRPLLEVILCLPGFLLRANTGWRPLCPLV